MKLEDLLKTALGQDPQTVLNGMPAGAPGRAALQRGLGLQAELPHMAAMVPQAAKAVSAVANTALAPFGGRAMDAMASLGNRAVKHPRALALGVGALAAAPILANAFTATQQKREDELMNAYNEPGRTIVASLEEFLEKRAATYNASNSSIPMMSPFRQGMHDGPGRFMDSFSGGIGGGIASALTESALGSLGGLFGKIRDSVVTDPKRQRLFDSIVRTDPIVSDAVSRHPDGLEIAKEAFGTMTRFAPSLSTDPNAVRSFLREAMIGGAGVNYATIKNLVETEKTITYGVR